MSSSRAQSNQSNSIFESDAFTADHCVPEIITNYEINLHRRKVQFMANFLTSKIFSKHIGAFRKMMEKVSEAGEWPDLQATLTTLAIIPYITQINASTIEARAKKYPEEDALRILRGMHTVYWLLKAFYEESKGKKVEFINGTMIHELILALSYYGEKGYNYKDELLAWVAEKKRELKERKKVLIRTPMDLLRSPLLVLSSPAHVRLEIPPLDETVYITPELITAVEEYIRHYISQEENSNKNLPAYEYRRFSLVDDGYLEFLLYKEGRKIRALARKSPKWMRKRASEIADDIERIPLQKAMFSLLSQKGEDMEESIARVQRRWMTLPGYSQTEILKMSKEKEMKLQPIHERRLRLIILRRYLLETYLRGIENNKEPEAVQAFFRIALGAPNRERDKQVILNCSKRKIGFNSYCRRNIKAFCRNTKVLPEAARRDSFIASRAEGLLFMRQFLCDKPQKQQKN